ncbi:hypothetical protein NK718_15225 [Alsobacter sp. SYSU M60028]|uniref:Uncharacterized protein n=1 Tax=Alsobacter ponti TaxID=2962936 RepID=A0ABT1LEL9_9HYPH|nr:hypothetical protein [Alsobacter ponti]MCP8939879.1 hypothetical protein [Alsobacter ponti]
MATWLEKRRERRRRRERFEEIVAWIVVPALALAAWWGWLQVRDYVKAAPLLSIMSGKDAAREP